MSSLPPRPTSPRPRSNRPTIAGQKRALWLAAANGAFQEHQNVAAARSHASEPTAPVASSAALLKIEGKAEIIGEEKVVLVERSGCEEQVKGEVLVSHQDSHPQSNRPGEDNHPSQPRVESLSVDSTRENGSNNDSIELTATPPSSAAAKEEAEIYARRQNALQELKRHHKDPHPRLRQPAFLTNGIPAESAHVKGDVFSIIHRHLESDLTREKALVAADAFRPSPVKPVQDPGMASRTESEVSSSQQKPCAAIPSSYSQTIKAFEANPRARAALLEGQRRYRSGKGQDQRTSPSPPLTRKDLTIDLTQASFKEKLKVFEADPQAIAGLVTLQRACRSRLRTASPTVTTSPDLAPKRMKPDESRLQEVFQAVESNPRVLSAIVTAQRTFRARPKSTTLPTSPSVYERQHLATTRPDLKNALESIESNPVALSGIVTLQRAFRSSRSQKRLRAAQHQAAPSVSLSTPKAPFEETTKAIEANPEAMSALIAIQRKVRLHLQEPSTRREDVARLSGLLKRVQLSVREAKSDQARSCHAQEAKDASGDFSSGVVDVYQANPPLAKTDPAIILQQARSRLAQPDITEKPSLGYCSHVIAARKDEARPYDRLLPIQRSSRKESRKEKKDQLPDLAPFPAKYPRCGTAARQLVRSPSLLASLIDLCCVARQTSRRRERRNGPVWSHRMMSPSSPLVTTSLLTEGWNEEEEQIHDAWYISLASGAALEFRSDAEVADLLSKILPHHTTPILEASKDVARKEVLFAVWLQKNPPIFNGNVGSSRYQIEGRPCSSACAEEAKRLIRYGFVQGKAQNAMSRHHRVAWDKAKRLSISRTDRNLAMSILHHVPPAKSKPYPDEIKQVMRLNRIKIKEKRSGKPNYSGTQGMY